MKLAFNLEDHVSFANEVASSLLFSISMEFFPYEPSVLLAFLYIPLPPNPGIHPDSLLASLSQFLLTDEFTQTSISISLQAMVGEQDGGGCD